VCGAANAACTHGEAPSHVGPGVTIDRVQENRVPPQPQEVPVFAADAIGAATDTNEEG
jgi:hypothetical protein